VHKGADEVGSNTDDRIVEYMDGGELVETDQFLVARGQFLGIGIESNDAPVQLHLDAMGLD
jgi:hypothetical protein